MMTTASIRSEWLKTRKNPLTLWVTRILLIFMLVYPLLAVWLSRFFVIDTSQGLRVWLGPLPEEALPVAQQMREGATLPDVIPTTLNVAASLGRLLMVILGSALIAREMVGARRRRQSDAAGLAKAAAGDG